MGDLGNTVAIAVAIALLLELRTYTAIHVGRLSKRLRSYEARTASLERKLGDFVDPADGEAA